MAEELEKRLRARREAGASARAFAERLLEAVARIQQQFDGPERDRLLALAGQTLDRHLEIQKSALEARAALEQLRADQQRLLRLIEFALAPRRDGPLH